MKYLTFLILFLGLPLLAFAQATTGAVNTDTGFVPLTNIPQLTEVAGAFSLEAFLNALYRISIGIAAVVAVLQIMRAGIMYMGSDSGFAEKKEAKNLIALSIGGLILVLSPVIVFSVINPEILTLKIGNIEKLRSTKTTEPEVADPAEDRRICEGYVEPTYVVLPDDKSCSDVKGGGWTKLSGFCCPVSGTPQPGASCCAKNSSYVPPPPRPGDTGTFTFKVYSSYSETNGDGSRLPTCRLTNERTFTSIDACEAGFTSAVNFYADRTKYPDYAVAKTCSAATESGTPVPASSWNRINAFPSC